MFLKSTFLLALVALLSACGKAQVAEKPTSMVIVHTSGTVQVIQNGQAVPARVGLLVQVNDEIRTLAGSVDLQTRGGSAIRLKENTRIKVAKLLGQGDTRLSMEQGRVLATVKKSRADEEFAIVTPTAIAGVRGTTFTVEMEKPGSSPRVRVLDGKVAMSPRIPALEAMEGSAIDADANLSRLAEIQERNEIVVEANTAATFNPIVENKIKTINEALEKADESQESLAAAARTDVVQKASVELASVPRAVVTREAPVTAAELAEKASLVVVDQTVVEKVISGDEPTAVQAMTTQREERTTAAAAEIADSQAQVHAIANVQKEAEVARIQKEAAQRQLRNQAAIRAYYQKMETVILLDGSMHQGAVIAQTDDELVLHTPAGVVRLRKDQVDTIEFQ